MKNNEKNPLLLVHGPFLCVNTNVHSPEVYRLAKPHTG